MGFCAGILQRNLAELPQLLNAALGETQLIDSVQLICIDGSKFENAGNPALEIYAEIVAQGFPERQNGELETMQQLKVYCQLKCREIFLIFYEDTTDPPPQGFSPTFLTSLSKFSNVNRICVVSDQANIPLQSFSPHQPNLIADIVGWIRGIVMES